MNILNYKPGITVLHVEDDKKTAASLVSELVKRQISVFSVDNLEDAVNAIKKCSFNFVVCDGMFPVKKGLPESKSFIPLVEKIKALKKNPEIIAWSNSTHVHEYCKKHSHDSYSKKVLAREDFNKKGREFIKVSCFGASDIAGIIEKKLISESGFAGLLKSHNFESFYSEPITVFGAFLSADMRTGLFKNTAGLNYDVVIIELNNGLCNLFMDKSEDKKISGLIYNKIINKNFFPVVYRNILSCSVSLLRFSRSLKAMDYSRCSGRDISKLYIKFCDLLMTMRTFSSIPMALEHGTGVWTSLIRSILIKKIKDEQELNRVFSLLTTPEKISYVRQFDLDCANVGIKKFTGKDIKKDIKDLLDKYAWINYTFEGIPIDEKYIAEKISSLGKSREDFEIVLKSESSRLSILTKEKKNLFRKFNFSGKDIEYFSIGANLVFLKFYRKGVFAESYYNVEFLLEEIGRRVSCSRKQVANMLPYEVLAALELGSFNCGIIDRRIKESILFHHAGKTFAFNSDFKALYADRIVEEAISSEISGQTAFPGTAKGIVRLVNVAADMKNFSKGDILVSRSTNPALVNAMEKSAAIITDIGGLTCHAAIVAREMKKPCIVGTKTATKVLKDGDYVEVDADKGIVKKL